MAHIQNSEVLIKEYLTYRGFTGCLKSFENECRNDKNRSFRTDKIIGETFNVYTFFIISLYSRLTLLIL